MHNKICISIGCFFYINNQDKANGLLLTSSTNLIKLIDKKILKITNLYIVNPVTKNYQYINNNNIYFDETFNIAIIKTNINLIDSNIPLKLADSTSNIDDKCYILSNIDVSNNHVSILKGRIINNNYYKTDFNSYSCLLTNIIYYNDSPILNNDGEIIGMSHFCTDNSCKFAYGINLNLLKQTLLRLTTFPKTKKNLDKKYIGIKWIKFNILKHSNFVTKSKCIKNQGLYILDISKDSPFYKVILKDDIILSLKIKNKIYELGVMPNQFTLDILFYNFNDEIIELVIVRKNKKYCIKNIII